MISRLVETEATKKKQSAEGDWWEEDLQPLLSHWGPCRAPGNQWEITALPSASKSGRKPKRKRFYLHKSLPFPMLKGLLPAINFNFSGALNLFAFPGPGKRKWRVISTVCSLLISSGGSASPVEKGFRFFLSLWKIVGFFYWRINLFHCRSQHAQRKEKKKKEKEELYIRCLCWVLLAHGSRPTGWQQPLLPARTALPAWLPVRGSLSSHTPRHVMCRTEMNFRLDYFALQVQGSVESAAAIRHSTIIALLRKAFCWTVLHPLLFPARTERYLATGFNASLHIFSLLHVYLLKSAVFERQESDTCIHRHSEETSTQTGGGVKWICSTRSWHPLFHPPALMALLPSVGVRCITVLLSLAMRPSDYMGSYFELFLGRESRINIFWRITTYKWDPWNHECERKRGKTNKRNFCSLLRLRYFLHSYSSHTQRKLLNPKIYKPLVLRWCSCFTSTDFC